jgi:hypothetical protein
MSGCTVQRLEAPGLTFLKVSGTVDETFSASQLSGQIRADTILHLGKVTRFSSFGVREWVRLMKDLQGRVKHCILVECSPAVVNQLNMVVDFAAGAHVKSVQLPYACQSCELDKLVTVDVDAQRAELLAGTLPQVSCPQCKNPMVFDDLPGSYLAFLRDAAAPESGSPMARFIASFEQAAPKLGDIESIGSAPPSAPAAAASTAPAAPAIDPTVPPPDLLRQGGGGGMKWVGLAAAVVVVVGGAYFLGGRQPKVDVTPPTPPPGPAMTVDNTPKTPVKPEKRGMTPEEGNTLQTLQSARRFTEAEEFIKKHEEAWKEDTIASDRANLLVARNQASNEEIQNAQKARAAGKLAEANEALDRASVYAAGETDGLLFERIQNARRAGNCPSVLAYVEALAQQFPTSVWLKKANDYKRPCMAQPSISLQELTRAMKPRQADIETCLKTPIGTEHQATDIELAWTVNTTGAVTAASCLTPAMAKENICQCLTEQVKQMRFTEKPGTTARRANYKFTPISG